MSYYTDLFTSNSPMWEDIDKTLVYLEHRVDSDMNKHLDSQFTEDEIRKAFFDLNPSKTPSPNGYVASFYLTLWNAINHDVYKEVKNS